MEAIRATAIHQFKDHFRCRGGAAPAEEEEEKEEEGEIASEKLN